MKSPARIKDERAPLLLLLLRRTASSLKRRAPLWLFVSVITALYSAFAILRHLHFGSGLDLAIFDQSIWLYSRFSAPLCTVRFNLPENILGDHFHPVLAALAPVYWIFDRAEALLVAQSLLLALSAVPVFLFAEKRLGKVAAWLITISYSIFWGMQRTAEFEFHEVAFAVPLISFAIYFIERKRRRGYYLCLLLLLLTKEDMTFLVAFFGIYLCSQRRYKEGIISLALGLLSFPLITKVIIPYFSGKHYTYWSYRTFGDGPVSSIKTVLTSPGLFFRTLVTPGIKLSTMWLIFSPFLFLSLASPLVVLALPLLLERFLSDNPNFWEPLYHYTATISPVVAMAAIDGISRIAGLINRLRARTFCVYIICSAILAINLLLLPGLPLWVLTSKGFWQFSDAEKSGHAAVTMIPSSATVLAQGNIMTHLTHRRYIYRFNPGVDLPDCDYIIASKEVTPAPYSGFAEIEDYLRRQMEKGYVKAFERDGWIVLKSPMPPLDTRLPPVLLTENDTGHAAALDSERLTRGPFKLSASNPISRDSTTRLILFSSNVELDPKGESIRVAVQAQDSAGRVYTLEVEAARPLPRSNGLTQLVVKLPTELQGAGQVWLSIGSHGRVSNRALIEIR